MSTLYSHVPLFSSAIIFFPMHWLELTALIEGCPPIVQWQSCTLQNLPHDSAKYLICSFICLTSDMHTTIYPNFCMPKSQLWFQDILLYCSPNPQWFYIKQNLNYWICLVPFAFPITSVSSIHKQATLKILTYIARKEKCQELSQCFWVF